MVVLVLIATGATRWLVAGQVRDMTTKLSGYVRRHKRGAGADHPAPAPMRNQTLGQFDHRLEWVTESRSVNQRL